MASSPNVEMEAVELLLTCLGEYGVCDARARDDLINENSAVIIDTLKKFRGLILNGETESGSSSETSKGGPLAASEPSIGLNSTDDWDKQLNDEDGKKGTKKRKKVVISVVEPPGDNTHQRNTCNLNPLVSTIAVDEDGIRPTHKLKSEVWNHFKKEKINDAMKAICNYCGKMLGGESKKGTTHLHYHLKICSSRKQRDITQSCFKVDKANDGNLATMIILHEYPVGMVEDKGFRNFLNYVQPSFKMVSRLTIQKDIFDIYEKERFETMKMLESNRSRIAISVNLWTTGDQKKEYMSITAHFIDDSWNLQSRTIRFACVLCPYTADTIFDVLMECLLDWNIGTKLSTLVVDMPNIVMVNDLLDKFVLRITLLHRDLFWIDHCAYYLNFRANEGLMEVGESIQRIRDSVAYWIATPKRLETFRLAARHLEISCTEELVVDCETRWNSQFLMLKSALKYEKVFPFLRQREIQYTSLPLEKDWIFAREVCDKFEVFYSKPQSSSRTKYPTFNMLFLEMIDIRLNLSAWCYSELHEIKVIAQKLISIFESYWVSTRSCVTIAAILDPRFKMRLVEFYFSQIYEDQYIEEIEHVRALCEEFVEGYRLNSSIMVECSSSSTSYRRQDVDNFVQFKDRLLQFDYFVSNFPSIDSTDGVKDGVKAELDMYLREPIVPRSDDFDILIWWKLNGARYPTLYQIARDILAIPITSVSSKLASGHGRRQISPQRSNLRPKLLEVLMCTQDWLWAKDDRGSTSLSADVDLD